ncbi:MAG: hypothetical protein IJ836_02825 [Spirochaetales bacterium]|nr:hypothetical protein [Spirochaetales bacterium]
MKKIAIVLIALLVLAMFVACDSDSTEVKELTQAQIEEYSAKIVYIRYCLVNYFLYNCSDTNMNGPEIQSDFNGSSAYYGTTINTATSSYSADSRLLTLKNVSLGELLLNSYSLSSFGPYDIDIVMKELGVKKSLPYAFAISASSSSDSFDFTYSYLPGNENSEQVEISNLVINGDTYNVEPLETSVNEVLNSIPE